MADPERTNLRDFPSGRPALQPHTRAVSSVTSERVSWLWPGRLAIGKITIMDGDPGLGKSTITLDLAARISRGLPLPGDTHHRGIGVGNPRGVLILSAEDGDSDTIRPRLDAAGADVRRVFLFSMRDEENNDYLPSLDQHVDGIRKHIESTDAALVIIDPLMAYLGANVKGNNDQDVRRVLSPFSSMLHRMKCSAMLLRHINKAIGMSPLHRGGGSIGIIGAARFGLLVGKDEDDETGQRRILAINKVNIGAEEPSLAYHLVGVPGTDVARIEWLGESPVVARDLLGQKTDSERSGLKEAEGWLEELLANGPRDAKELQKLARDSGISWRTVEDAKKRLGAQSGRKGFGTGSTWKWWIPKLLVGGKTPSQQSDDNDLWEDE